MRDFIGWTYIDWNGMEWNVQFILEILVCLFCWLSNCNRTIRLKCFMNTLIEMKIHIKKLMKRYIESASLLRTERMRVEDFSTEKPTNITN